MKKLLFFLLVQSSLTVSGQTVLENNPPSVKWYQVNTPHFRVIYPTGFEAQGQRVANTLEYIHDEEARTLQKSIPRKISIILQNQSAVSNGFVSQLPRRSEFYGMPPQDYNYLGNTDWLNLLASHEYRHIVQYQHAFRGFNKAFYYLFGATAFAGMSQAAAPMWFWEGDAVATETAFTSTGRGRIPNFGLVFKTNLLERRTFNYHKQYLRSYKHFIPDHYVLGYYMVSYLRKRTNDPDIWGKITRRSFSVPFLPFAFSNAIKKETGMHVTKLYREMANDFKKEWKEDLDQLELTPFEQVSKRKNGTYTDYQYPQALEDGSVLVLKSGIGDIQTFSILKEGKEVKVFRPGVFNDAGMLSLNNNVLVWTEFGFHPRFLVKNFSLVKAIDVSRKAKYLKVAAVGTNAPQQSATSALSHALRTGVFDKAKIIGSKKSRYGSAAVSPDGKQVVAIETTTKYLTSIVVLNTLTGAVEKKQNNPGNFFYSMPRWSPDGKYIVVLKTVDGKKTITRIDAQSMTEDDLIEATDENIGHPVAYGNFIFYNSGISGIDNVYALNVNTKSKFQVTSSRYGAYNPSISPNGKYIYYNEQTKNGLDVVRVAYDTGAWDKYQSQPRLGPTYDQVLIEQEANTGLMQKVVMDSLPVKKYSKIKGLVNPYAWGLNVETDLTQATIGLVSQDLLSTTALSAGYSIDINERTGAWKATVSYQGLLPIFDLSAALANRNVVEGAYEYERLIGGDTVVASRDLRFKWKEKTLQAGIRIPLVLTRSKYYTELEVGNTVGYTQVTNFANSITGGGRILPYTLGDSVIFRDYTDNGSIVFNTLSFTFSHLLKQSRRDINSRWGQRLIINAYNTPFGGDFSGNQFSGYGLLYFPGLFKHHSIWGYGGYQYTEIANDRNSDGKLDNYIFRNRIPLPRGLTVPRLEHVYTASINYTLPLWYPDIAIGPLLNIQRFRANGFVDYGYITSDIIDYAQEFISAGVELRVDFNVMRFFPQFDIGVRFTKGIKPSVTDFEVLIGTFNF